MKFYNQVDTLNYVYQQLLLQAKGSSIIFLVKTISFKKQFMHNQPYTKVKHVDILKIGIPSVSYRILEIQNTVSYRDLLPILYVDPNPGSRPTTLSLTLFSHVTKVMWLNLRGPFDWSFKKRFLKCIIISNFNYIDSLYIFR